MGKKGKVKEIVDKLWPRTKKELEKALEGTKDLVDKGEKYIKAFSEKGLRSTRKLSLVLKREKLYYSLGKLAAETPQSKWGGSGKINNVIKNIATLTKEIKKIK